MRQEAVTLDAASRVLVENVARDVCDYKGWLLLAVHARPQHVHLVVSAGHAPEQIALTIKSWTTRRLSEAGRIPPGTRTWSRHMSTVYLWTRESCDRAVHYVVHEQGEPLPGASPHCSGSPLPYGRGTENAG